MFHEQIGERKDFTQLQQFVFRFKDIDRRYLQIKSIAEQVVDRLLAERKSLLTSALVDLCIQLVSRL